MTVWAVMGEGTWAEALARRLAASGGRSVRLVGGRVRRPARARAVADPADALTEAERVVVAAPPAALETCLREAAPHLEGHHRIVTVAGGLTPGGGLLPSEAVRRLTCVRQTAVLAGAVDPEALEAGTPAAVVVGSAFPGWAAEIQAALASPTLRVYTNADPVGVELAGALADVLAVALGAARGLAAGPATEATALTRALAEMDRLVSGLGGDPGTAWGLAGLGVLATRLLDGRGAAFVRGRTLAEAGPDAAAPDGDALAETADSLAARAAAQGLDAPMVTMVRELLRGRVTVADGLGHLMARAARAEIN